MSANSRSRRSDRAPLCVARRGSKRRVASLLLIAMIGGAWLNGCGGSTQEPATPEPSSESLLEDEVGNGVAPASSPKVQEGMDAIAEEDFAKAKGVLEQAVAESPNDPQAVFYLGVAQAGLGENEAALSQMRKALELKPDFTEASINLSALLLDQGNLDEALEAADAGLKAAPNDPSLLQNKGMALFDKGDNTNAAPVLARVVELAPDNEELRFLYAQSLLGSEQHDQAKEQLVRLQSSEQVAVLASVADAWGRLGQWPECIAALDRAIEKEPVAELYVKRGLCRHGKKDEEGAKKDFETAIEKDARFAKAYFYLGHNLKERGDKKGAKKAFEKAAELDDGKLGQAAKKALANL